MNQPMVNDWTDEELQALAMDRGQLRDLLMRQRSTGQGLMGTPGAQGYQVGGTYRAASPLEHMAVALQRAMGARQVGQADQRYETSLGEDARVGAGAARRDLSSQGAIEEMIRRLAQAQSGQAPGLPMFGPGF